MSDKLNVCLINDSFPPLIDGIANTVVNYGHIINNELGSAVVATPYYPNCDDSSFDFPVKRFPSLNTKPLVGYRAGIPFSAETISELEAENFDIIHSHCPIASSMLGRVLRDSIDKPLVFTYHTKYDIDIHNSLHGHLIQEGAIKALVDNVAASDEVWAVSEGAGKNIQSLGYQGDFIVMHNGVDFPKGRVEENLIAEATEGFDLPDGIPIYLFVGRIMWYKGLRIILDALKKLKDSGQDFRMVFVGGGLDKNEIVSYTKTLGLNNKVIFHDAIGDRATLKAWYCKANLFIFPSTFDTNGLVVREAAACSLPSVLIKGSCAAEDTIDGRNAFWIEENANSLFALLSKLGNDTKIMRNIGENAANELYISWEDAVKVAYERYHVVIDNYKAGGFEKRQKLTDQFFQASADAIDNVLTLQNHRREMFNEAKQNIDSLTAELKEINSVKIPGHIHEMRQHIKDEFKTIYDESVDFILKEMDRYK